MAQRDGTLTAQRIPNGHHHDLIRRREHADSRPLGSGAGRLVVAGVRRGWSAIIIVRLRRAPHETGVDDPPSAGYPFNASHGLARASGPAHHTTRHRS
jgi:hypothetical protein